MTSEERLIQTEKLLETAARYIDRHSQMIVQNEDEIRQLRIENETEIKQLRIENEVEIKRLRIENETEMRQLRTSIQNVTELVSELATYQQQNQEEIRRIWEYLLSQSNNGHSGN